MDRNLNEERGEFEAKLGLMVLFGFLGYAGAIRVQKDIQTFRNIGE
jgi:hypothetical protein